VVTPKQAPVVSGNFEQIKAFLQVWKTKVLAMKMSEDNMEEVRTIKKEAVQYRNSLTKIQTDVKRLYFNDPKAVFDAQMTELLAVVGHVEDAADGVLASEERERVSSANQVLDHYKEKLQEQYELDQGYLERVEYKKDFYNKTVPKGYPSMDKYWKESLEQQFKELKKEQNAYAANMRLIETACKDEPRLNVKHWIEQLQYDDVATIVEAITAEKNRLHELDVQPTETTQTANSGQDVEYEIVSDEEALTSEEKATAVLGVPHTINWDSDFPGRTKSIKVEITYPCDLGDALTEMFKNIKPYGIKVTQLKKETVF
jgi:(2Fe-2S) ferredoxin